MLCNRRGDVILKVSIGVATISRLATETGTFKVQPYTKLYK